VLEGTQNLSQGLRPGSVYVDITTNSPETVLRLHKAMEQLGVEMLDAPINDCPVGTQSQGGMGLAVLASGSRVTFERVQPILQLMADHVLYCGEIGCGTQCKLIHNAVNAIAVQAVSEGITLALALGIPLQTIWDALRFGAFGQNAGDIHGLPHYWFSRRCDDLDQHPAFTVKLLHKDLRLALAMASQHNISVPHLSLTVKDYEQAERRGWSDYATTKVRCLQEERAGVIAKATPSVISSSTQRQPQSTPTRLVN
jgi:3-hydroxyisobutyrate dehydrogenase-like beta-hydroxyacid dehydrogenase